MYVCSIVQILKELTYFAKLVMKSARTYRYAQHLRHSAEYRAMELRTAINI